MLCPLSFCAVQETGLLEYPFLTETDPLPPGENIPAGVHWVTPNKKKPPNTLKLTLFKEEEQAYEPADNTKGDYYSTTAAGAAK